MKWIANIIDWFLRETWWRHYYKRITLDELDKKVTWKCSICDAGNPNNKSIRCSIIHGRTCPCKYNQYLLSIEQKAKAYDEALNRAKRMFSKKECEFIFPELKESEDEWDAEKKELKKIK